MAPPWSVKWFKLIKEMAMRPATTTTLFACAVMAMPLLAQANRKIARRPHAAHPPASANSTDPSTPRPVRPKVDVQKLLTLASSGPRNDLEFSYDDGRTISDAIAAYHRNGARANNFAEEKTEERRRVYSSSGSNPSSGSQTQAPSTSGSKLWVVSFRGETGNYISISRSKWCELMLSASNKEEAETIGQQMADDYVKNNYIDGKRWDHAWNISVKEK